MKETGRRYAAENRYNYFWAEDGWLGEAYLTIRGYYPELGGGDGYDGDVVVGECQAGLRQSTDA